jgi:putative tricarboxylic transport membrane protein
VGFDKLTDLSRFDFGAPALQAGIELVPVTVGIFGLAEVMRNLAANSGALPPVPSLGKLFPPISSLLKVWASVIRGGLTGVLVGAVPAAGSAIAVVLSYEQEKRFSKNPAGFGHGEPAGIAGPESANSSAVGGALIPMMTLGIPGDSITAVLMGALMVHGLKPGPMLFLENPEFVAGTYASLFLSIALTLIVGFAFIRLIILVMRVPSHIMYAAITLLCIVGSFAIRNSLADVFIMTFFGVVGYLMHLIRTPPAPLAFGLILGPLLEENLRRSLMLSGGSWTIFVERPLSATILLASLATLVLPLLMPAIKRGTALIQGQRRSARAIGE